MSLRPLVAVAFAVITLATTVGAQDLETVRITHRFDWRRTVDQRYQGLVYGYLSGAWKLRPGTESGWTEVEARYQVGSESKRNNALTEKAISGQRLARFRIDPQGNMVNFVGDGVPYYRNFPAPLPPNAGPGTTWTGTGELVGDFLGTGWSTGIPILIEYRWEGMGDYQGTPVIQVRTQYALRYRSGLDATGDPTLTAAEGSRVGMVSYQSSDRRVVFVRETTREVFTAIDGRRIGNDGILLTFFEGVPALGTTALATAFDRALHPEKPLPPPPSPSPTPKSEPGPTPAPTLVAVPSPTPTPTPVVLPPGPETADVRVEADPRGVKLTLDNLKFVADRPTLLPGEDRRLARIAELLKTVPGRNLLVVGHTAAIGTVESQDSLSVERALAIVERLKAAGIPAQRLLYEGRGGRDPVADNGTEVGRAQNRRVEILILDQ